MEFVDLGSVGVRFVARATQTGAAFSVVEHPIPPYSLVAPMHRHSHEDEYSYVIEGRLGAKLGEKVVYADAGELVSKPRGQWHTFWNPSHDPCRVLEIISPGGFERFFADLAAAQGSVGFDRAQLRELGARTEPPSTPRAFRGCAPSTGSRTPCSRNGRPESLLRSQLTGHS
jgi:mannose-6-phosphate isomerase-like protein (cupin superfamily)